MKTVWSKNDLHALPKIELHCHLDGSVPVEVFEGLAFRGYPGVPREHALLMQKIRAPRLCRGLSEYLRGFTLALSVLKDMDVLWQAARALGRDLAKEGVVYAELRFAPLLLASAAADAGAVVRTVLQAMAACQKEHGIVLRALLCMMRHADEPDNRRVLDLAYRYQGDGVVGIDLAGDEAPFPAPLFSGLFRRSADMGLACTIHAGECGSADNVRQSVAMGARRIGHGVAAIQDPGLCRLLARDGVLLENCPLSNLQTGAVAKIEDHPLPALAAQGVPVCISTDNRTISATSLTEEYHVLAEHFKGIDATFLKARTLNALNGAFLPEADKKPLRAAVEAGFSKIPAPLKHTCCT